jgi:hypothetical protein
MRWRVVLVAFLPSSHHLSVIPEEYQNDSTGLPVALTMLYTELDYERTFPHFLLNLNSSCNYILMTTIGGIRW